MLEAASNSMKQKEWDEPKKELIEEAAKLPDASKELKNDVDAVHKYAREQLSAASDDTTKILALADLDRDAKVEVDVKNIVNENNLKNGLDHAVSDGLSLDEVYTNVTGKTPDWSPAGVNMFQDSLVYTLRIVSQITGTNAGAYALMTGKFDEYLNALTLNPNRKPIEVKNPELLSPTVKNLL